MELISYEEFGKFDIRPFVQNGIGVVQRDDWEWRGGIWTNESVGACTGVSRHESMPEEVGGLEIDFRDLPEKDALAFFNALRLPLKPGMTLQEVQGVLGEPKERGDFIEDRKGYGFDVGARYPYEVGCIIRDSAGLVYVSVIRKDVLSKCDT
jgi:hypothetical protein